ncbi:MAG: DUF362 domain-containing protein [Candidatus Pacebacteria bacterium]|nr:DUF362 domain-containing protein [Candidatus Paceibacterota bacterium]
MSATTFSTAGISRRDFIRTGIAGTAILATRPTLFAAEPEAEVWMIHGDDKAKLMTQALKVVDQNGGLGTNVKTLALKVNAAWARKPERGATTHPTLIKTFLEGCQARGITKTVVPENPCVRAEHSFTRSGIQEVVEAAGSTMIDLKSEKKRFADVNIPNGKNLRKAEVARDFLEADAVVNMPIAKHHGGAKLTMALKNWMGAVWDRGYWHRNNLHQCIADFGSFMKPNWTIIDATRIMLTRGPQGPTRDMKHPNLLILSKDQVAADSVATLLFHDSPYEIPFLKFADDMGIGVVSPDRITVHKVEA